MTGVGRVFVANVNELKNHVSTSGMVSDVIMTREVKAVDFSNLEGCNKMFFNCVFTGMTFIKCCFKDVIFTNCAFKNTIFRDCDIDEASFSHCDLDSARMESCSLQKTHFSNSVIGNTEISRSNLTDVRGFSKRPSACPNIDAQSAVFPFIRKNVKCFYVHEVDEYSLDEQLGPRMHRVSGVVWPKSYYPATNAAVACGYNKVSGRVPRNVMGSPSTVGTTNTATTQRTLLPPKGGTTVSYTTPNDNSAHMMFSNKQFFSE